MDRATYTTRIRESDECYRVCRACEIRCDSDISSDRYDRTLPGSRSDKARITDSRISSDNLIVSIGIARTISREESDIFSERIPDQCSVLYIDTRYFRDILLAEDFHGGISWSGGTEISRTRRIEYPHSTIGIRDI